MSKPKELTGEVLPPTKNLVPRDYQVWAYNWIAQAIRKYEGPFFVEASVGAGKTAIMAMILAQCQLRNMSVLVLARRGELVEQNADAFWDAGVQNSIFSSSVGVKATKYPIIVGSEGTVARALDGALKDFCPSIIVVDECHEVDFLSPDGQYMRIINEMILRNAKNDRKMRIIGMTGSPYRGVKDIIGPFWKSCVFKVRTPYLVEREYLVRTLFGFGHDETQYDLSEFKIDENDDHSDYTKDQLDQMQKKIVADKKVTQLIVEEVVRLTAHRNAVMITGAGKKHLMQIAEFLPEDSWVIITDSTGNRERRISLKQVYDGKKKFVLQIGCLTTGIDIPLIDTSVIMRKIGSLTLLVQLLGRGMRLLKPFQKEAGIIKDDHLVLDYSGTMAEMADIYDDPVLEKAALDKAKQDDADMVVCGACQTRNSPRAQRCVGRIEDGDDTRMFQVMRTTRDGLPVHNFSLDGRCENFFNSKECPFCGTPNSNSARECRQCEGMLVDPSKNLSARHYVDEDFRGVLDMKLALTKNAKGIVVTYIIDGPVLNEGAKTVNFFGESREVAVEIFHPHGAEKWMKLKWIQFVEQHTTTSARKLLQGKSAVDIVKLSNLITKPSQITHRVNSDGKSIVYRRR